jgi:hypothetical protein
MRNDSSSNETQEVASEAPTPQQQTQGDPKQNPDKGTMLAWFVPPIVVPALLVIAVIAAALL